MASSWMEAEGVAPVRVDGLVVVVARGTVRKLHDSGERGRVHLRVSRRRFNLRALDAAGSIDDVVDGDTADGIRALQRSGVRRLRGAELRGARTLTRLTREGSRAGPPCGLSELPPSLPPGAPFAALASGFAAAEGLAGLSDAGFASAFFSGFSSFASFISCGSFGSFSISGALRLSSMTIGAIAGASIAAASAAAGCSSAASPPSEGCSSSVTLS